MSDIKSPCDKTATFGGGGKLCPDKPKTEGSPKGLDLTLAPPPPGMFDDLVSLSGQTSGSQEPSMIDQGVQEYKDSPVKPMFGGPLGIKGVTVKIKI